MGKHAYNRHELELRREKLFLRQNLVDKLESSKHLDLDEFVSFIWHRHPNYVGELTLKLLREVISARQRGESFTQDDWNRFTKEMSGSKSSRDIVLSKLMYLGLIEKRNKTKMKYEIIASDKWIHYLELLAQSWVMICENGSKVKR